MIITDYFPIETRQLSPETTKKSHHYSIMNAMINALCVKLVLEEKKQDFKIRFSEITEISDWEQVIALRLKVYQQANQYMLNELSNGVDDFEPRSSVYAAWINDKMIATIRLTPYPFETLKYVTEDKLKTFLGQDFQTTYLEWSRLMVDPDIRNLKIMPALLIYAGMKVLTSTNYTHYFGFTKPIVRKLMEKFSIVNESLSFTIPARDNNTYLLLKGDFSTDFWKLADHSFSFIK